MSPNPIHSVNWFRRAHESFRRKELWRPAGIVKNRIRKYRINVVQKILLRERYPRDVKRLIVFLTPGKDAVNGGILSISSLYNETLKLKHLHGAEVIMCTIPGYPLLLRYTKFQNENYLYAFSDVLSYFSNIETLLIHIPEYVVVRIMKEWSLNDYLRLEKIEDLLITALDIEIKIRNDIRPHLNASDPEESARFSQLQAEVDSLSIVRTDLFKRLERIGSAIGSVAKETNLPQPTIYLVKKGDWLSKIAARREIYGDLSEWPCIYQANQDQIRDPDLIYPNQKFLIPR